MGSGGGSRGSGPTVGRPRTSRQPKGRPGSGGGGGSFEGGSDCDLSFETDLAGVNSAVAGGLGVGDILSVALVEQHGFPTVVCRTSSGQIVGSLANVEDLAQLISCMQQGHSYTATIRDVGATHCTVYVERA
jgi:hypothetical protein